MRVLDATNVFYATDINRCFLESLIEFAEAAANFTAGLDGDPSFLWRSLVDRIQYVTCSRCFWTQLHDNMAATQ